MDKNIKIYIAGHRGMVGSAIKKELEEQGYTNLIYRTHTELDLTEVKQVAEFFDQEQPEWVLLAAAKVGGIIGNSTYPVEFMLDNLKIQNNIIENAHRTNCKKLLFLGSSCIYPKVTPQPMKEEYLLSGQLEPTNEPYALAKICGIKLCNAYNKEYNTNYISVMPCNLYGLNDNYHEANAHVIPMMIRRFHQAKVNGDKTVTIWGTGTPRREFLYAGDLGKAVVYLMQHKNKEDIGEFINIGYGSDMTIMELAEAIKKAVGFEGQILLDTTKPDGTMLKLMDSSRMKTLGWNPQMQLEQGLQIAYQDFLTGMVKK